MEEFSHTILHGENIAKKIPLKAPPSKFPVTRASASPSPVMKSPIYNNPPINPPQRPLPYDPSKIYKNPIQIKRPQMLLQKSVEKKNPNDKRKPMKPAEKSVR